MSDPLEDLEGAWRAWRPGQEPPRWESYLPEGRLDPDEALCLMQIDVEFRARHGLPGVLTEPYLDRVPLDDARAAELVRWEYRQCRKHGRQARARDYAEAFPRLAAALAGLAPEQKCPVCGAPSDVDEGDDDRTVNCPRCPGPATIHTGQLPPPPEPPPAGGLDLRHHDLLDALGSGGMGEVYRTRDPGLGRDLALKVLRPAYARDPRAEARFLREARITAALQHPGIVPVHNLGRLADGRLFFSMKLVRGRTLERLIADEAPGLVAAFERVCEAVAYAHGQGVIHRDLKPANVMVGAFGEVQVMDWGLARRKDEGGGAGDEEGRGATPSPNAEAGTLGALAELGRLGAAVTVATRAGTVMGTPAFMPPEQARGEPADERSDVFALGAIVCAVLTGRPPFTGDALAQARAGDLGEASALLDACGADAGLVAICKECLAADPAARPADAGVVARRMAEHREGVERRLREAELERVEARERGRRLRLRLALVGVVALLLASAIGVGVWMRQRQAETDRKAGEAMARARVLQAEARRRPLDPAGFREAESVAEAAREMALAASAELSGEAEAILASARKEKGDAERDRVLLAALLDALRPGRVRFDTGGAVYVTPTTEDLLSAAFRKWGVDVDAAPEADVIAALSSRPPEVLREVAAGLDAWWMHRRRAGDPRAGRLLGLAASLDEGQRAADLRALLAGDLNVIPPAVLAAALVGRAAPFPAPPLPLHPAHRRLIGMTEGADPSGPPQYLVSLATSLDTAGEGRRGEGLLRAAVLVRPQVAFLHLSLGRLLANASPPRWDEAAECYAAARALRPELGLSLVEAVWQSGRRDQALALVERLTVESPDDADIRLAAAQLLLPNHPDRAMAQLREVLRREPGHAAALNNMALIHLRRGKWREAEAVSREAIRAAPALAGPRVNLGSALLGLGRCTEALAEADAALRLEEKAQAYYLKGMTLIDLKRPSEAAAAFRRATEVDPSDFRSFGNLGKMLHTFGDRAGAIEAFRRAAAANPRYDLGHLNLGATLLEAGRPAEALVPLRRAIALSPDLAFAHAALGEALYDLGRYAESAKSTREALKYLPARSPFLGHLRRQLAAAEKKLAPAQD